MSRENIDPDTYSDDGLEFADGLSKIERNGDVVHGRKVSKERRIVLRVEPVPRCAPLAVVPHYPSQAKHVLLTHSLYRHAILWIQLQLLFVVRITPARLSVVHLHVTRNAEIHRS